MLARLPLLLWFSVMVRGEDCTQPFKETAGDQIQVTYKSDPNALTISVEKLMIRVEGNKQFQFLLKDDCKSDWRKADVTILGRVESELGKGQWTELLTDKKLKTSVLVTEVIDPCMKYEVKLVAQLDPETKAELPSRVIGPYYTIAEDQLDKINPSPDLLYIEDNFANVSSEGFTVEWDGVCGQALQIVVHSDHQIKAVGNYTGFENVRRGELFIPAKPCSSSNVSYDVFLKRNFVDLHNQTVKFIKFAATPPSKKAFGTANVENYQVIWDWQDFENDCKLFANFTLYFGTNTQKQDLAHHKIWNFFDYSNLTEQVENWDFDLEPCREYPVELEVNYHGPSGYLNLTILSTSVRTNKQGKLSEDEPSSLEIYHNGNITVDVESCSENVKLELKGINVPSSKSLRLSNDESSLSVDKIDPQPAACVTYNLELSKENSNGTTTKLAETEYFAMPKLGARIDLVSSSNYPEMEIKVPESESKCKPHLFLVECDPDYSPEVNKVLEHSKSDGTEHFEIDPRSNVDLLIPEKKLKWRSKNSRMTISHHENFTNGMTYHCKAKIEYNTNNETVLESQWSEMVQLPLAKSSRDGRNYDGAGWDGIGPKDEYKSTSSHAVGPIVGIVGALLVLAVGAALLIARRNKKQQIIKDIEEQHQTQFQANRSENENSGHELNCALLTPPIIDVDEYERASTDGKKENTAEVKDTLAIEGEQEIDGGEDTSTEKPDDSAEDKSDEKPDDKHDNSDKNGDETEDKSGDNDVNKDEKDELVNIDFPEDSADD